ncbi:hypothetical protein [Plastoroseomonas arctica]|uniref:Lipoprotein n=1 Tax=Plastoroseomonas arctica TaxID=1509237 RepID=A0AAF1KKV8_9PROT|nr:hypothetical protein [Plastoroseomonas arctica]MBR0657030.1 hypothetical protein [Plastoroseomonas arctica]
MAPTYRPTLDETTPPRAFSAATIEDPTMRLLLLLTLITLAACETNRSSPLGPRGTALPPPDAITGR